MKIHKQKEKKSNIQLEFEHDFDNKRNKKQKEIRKNAYWREVVVPNFVPKRNIQKEAEREINKYKSTQESKQNKFQFVRIFEYK